MKTAGMPSLAREGVLSAWRKRAEGRMSSFCELHLIHRKRSPFSHWRRHPPCPPRGKFPTIGAGLTAPFTQGRLGWAFLNGQLVPLVKGESEWNEQGGLGILPSFSCENATCLFKDGKVAGGR